MIISQFINTPNYDCIWNYGFSYNISIGKIPYRDFNMIISPFYNIIFAPFLSMFGNYLIVFFILNSLMYSFVIVLISKKIGKNYFFILLYMATLPATFTYNSFIAFLTILILLIYDSNFKYREELISLVIGLIMITKQNIGFIMLIANFLVTNNKIKNMIISIIPMIFLCIYLAINNALYEYIDFCYLGLSKFSNNFNLCISVTIIIIPIIIWLFRKLIITKDKRIIYVLSFMFLLYPLIDETHLLPALIPFLYYFFLSVNDKKIHLIVKECLIIIFFILVYISYPFTLSNSNSFLYLINVSENTDYYLKNFGNYITSNNDKDIYLFTSDAYFIKLYLNIDISFYDIINVGNLGSNPQKYIYKLDENCGKKECLFIIDDEFNNNVPSNQLDRNFKEHIEKKYHFKETLPNGDIVYTNRK